MSVADILADVTVEIGFGVDAVGGLYFVLDDPVRGELDNATYLLAPDTVFVDVTEHVASITIDRGRDRELDEYGTGTATVVFNDDDRTFDPAYSGSPYFGEITPMKRINIKWRGVDLFSGWIDDWSVMYEPGDNLSRVTADCVDGFAILANQELDEIAAAHSGDLVGARINRVLNRDEVDYPASRAIDTGNSILGATTLGGNALAYLQACCRAEAGYLFVAADGTLTFHNRQFALDVPSGVTFSDDPAAGIPYRVVTQRSTSDLLFTRVTGESETTGNPLSSTSVSAAAEYLIRTLPLGTLFTSTDVQTQNIVDFHLERFKRIEERFHAATVATATLTETQVASLVSLDLTDIVTVERSPLGVGSTIERMSIIDGVSHRIASGSWITELNFANANTRAVFVLDHPVFGVLDANRLAF
jgi:hypothetical protein